MDRAQNKPSDENGYLVVQASTAGGAIPLEGAKVTVRRYESEAASSPEILGDAVASLTTGRDGRTPQIPLTAPPRANGNTPNGGPPYALYQVEVTLEGYYDQTYVGVPVFAGITAVQPAVLIPLSERGTVNTPRPEDRRYFETPSNQL
ncbi:MAG: hypothetical protein E7620_08650 [Ruminococcaceae bacterium]|nr:hypothetical protein [Oscillospiraceae bacterium]